ncbi:hypothetical protein LWI29_034007 [Acer saccharum]|uniref:Clp R domain-containing protein n=1 Tax=Acer saccharum TaxID=4024 RepID=A0AA39RFL4_ACESA|nr:hypothetical protein LWI29_034007 [Acer saccharum]
MILWIRHLKLPVSNNTRLPLIDYDDGKNDNPKDLSDGSNSVLSQDTTSCKNENNSHNGGEAVESECQKLPQFNQSSVHEECESIAAEILLSFAPSRKRVDSQFHCIQAKSNDSSKCCRDNDSNRNLYRTQYPNYSQAGDTNESKTWTKSANPTEFTEMAWEAIVRAFDVARVNNQQVESEHLMKSLLESALARRIFTKAGLDNSSVLQATDYIISQQSKVTGSTRGLIIGSHLSSLLDNARKNKKQMGDDFVSVEHLLLAFHSDKRFGKKLFKNLKLTEKDLKGAIAAVRGNQSVTDQYPEGKYEILDRYGNDLTELARRGKLDPVIGRDDEIQQCIRILSTKTKNNPVIIGEPGVGKTAIAEGLAQLIVRGDVLEKLRNRKLISVDMCSLVANAKYHGDLEERLRAVLKEVTASNGQIILFIDDIHTVVGAGASGSMNAEILLKMLGRCDLIGATTLNEYRKCIENDPSLEHRFTQVLCNQPSVEDTISILRGLRECYELYHGVKISDSAIVSAAVLADRYITRRFLPDKAIGLMDEAAAKLSIEMTSKPTELDEEDRALLKLEMEKLSLKNNTEERFSKVENDMNAINQKQKQLNEQQGFEKDLMTRIRSIKEKIDGVNLEMEAAECEYDLNRAVELKYGTLMSLQHQLEEAEKKLTDFQKSGLSLLRDEVTDIDIAEMVSQRTGIPLSNLQRSEQDKLIMLEEVLQKRVVGQDIAIKSVVAAIRRSRTGNRPIASFMFLGPTGVGKTELAKALAGYLFNTENALVRIDMSKYMEKHSVSRLVGAPPDYVGYEAEDGQLTEVVRQRPYSVVLFDKIEKAHHDVFKILLQLLDNGKLTDSQGRIVSFTNCIIIMTSNIGSQHILKTLHNPQNNSMDYEMMKRQVVELARQTFRSKFFMNSIDEYIVFQPLDGKRIIQIQLKQVQDRLKQRKKIDLHYTKGAVELLGTVELNPNFGARPVNSVIQQLIENELVMGVLRGDFKEGDSIMVDVDESPAAKYLPAQKKICVKKLDRLSEAIVDSDWEMINSHFA